MYFIVGLVSSALAETLVSFSHNWPYLLASVTIAGVLKVALDADAVSAFLNRKGGAGVAASVAAAVATPLCSCGTTAVVLGMMATTMPWAPVVAFMVASPLSSPEGMVYSAGIFGWPFAIYYFGASVFLGLAGGAAAAALQKVGYLENQTRFSVPSRGGEACRSCAPAPATGAAFAPLVFAVAEKDSTSARISSPKVSVTAARTVGACGCSAGGAPESTSPSDTEATARTTAWVDRGRDMAIAAFDAAKLILPLFAGFAFLGFLINGFIPSSAIAALFGEGRVYGVPLAATVGLPLYINSEASIPLARAFLDSGMSPGSIMAFLIAGSGTSLGAIGGALTIAKRRVVGLVVVVLWVGSIVVGYGYDGLLAAGAF